VGRGDEDLGGDEPFSGRVFLSLHIDNIKSGHNSVGRVQASQA
jgi:hypothetical protein